mgnify:CR=1 FL=1
MSDDLRAQQHTHTHMHSEVGERTDTTPTPPDRETPTLPPGKILSAPLTSTPKGMGKAEGVADGQTEEAVSAPPPPPPPPRMHHAHGAHVSSGTARGRDRGPPCTGCDKRKKNVRHIRPLWERGGTGAEREMVRHDLSLATMCRGRNLQQLLQRRNPSTCSAAYRGHARHSCCHWGVASKDMGCVCGCV